MKETFYFSHDYEPTSDPKIIAMLGNLGGLGYGAYWRIIEMLHSDETHKLPCKGYIYEAIAKQMLASTEQIQSMIADCINRYELFASDGEFFWSERVLRNIDKRKSISSLRSEAGKRGADAKQLLSKRKQTQAIAKQNLAKERKGKERKEIINTSSKEEGETPKEFGNQEINKILLAIKQKVRVDAFTETHQNTRIYGKHCMNLLKKIGAPEFSRRLDIILEDSFKQKNCNSLRYVYSQVKAFIEPQSIPSF